MTREDTTVPTGDHEPPSKARQIDFETQEIEEGVGLLSKRNPHLKWRVFDALEVLLAVLCAFLLFAFTTATAVDVLTRNLGRSFIVLQEVILGCFVWGVFLGAAAALRRGQHFYLTNWAKRLTGIGRIAMEIVGLGAMLVVFALVIYYGYEQFTDSFSVSMQVSSRPLALLTGAVPMFGLLGFLFTLEELLNGLRGGFDEPFETEVEDKRETMS